MWQHIEAASTLSRKFSIFELHDGQLAWLVMNKFRRKVAGPVLNLILVDANMIHMAHHGMLPDYLN